MTTLITSDLHFTDNPKDEYRWELFPWLRFKVQELKIDNIVLCGDICDKKDHHSSVLVNKLVDELLKLECNVFVLRGNHDALDPTNPFFRFTDTFPNIHYISEPSKFDLKISSFDCPCLFLPSTGNYLEDWNHISFDLYDYIFCHQSFYGARTESGYILDTGMPSSVFNKFEGQVFSGDIHAPQKIGKNIEYIGAPYHVHFGDQYDPRIIYIDEKGTRKDLVLPVLRKQVVEINHNNRTIDLPKTIEPGDQVKVRVYLNRADLAEWQEIRRTIVDLAKEREWILCGVESVLIDRADRLKSTVVVEHVRPRDLVSEYAKDHKVAEDSLKVGLSLIGEFL